MNRRRKLGLVVSVVVIVAVAVALLIAVVRGDAGGGSATSTPSTTAYVAPAPPQKAQASFAPVTGIRDGAPAVVSGAIVAAGSQSVPGEFAISALPNGVSVTSVLPSDVWSCTGATCSAPTIAAGTSTPVVMLLDVASTVAADATFTITPTGGAPATVALSLPDDAAALAPMAIAAKVAGPALLVPGATSNGIVAVANPSASPIDAGSLVVSLAPPLVTGLTVVGSGQDWSCASMRCTFAGTVAPYASAPTLTIEMATTSATVNGSGTFGATITASIGGANVTTSGSFELEIRPERSTGVSTRIALDHGSLVAPNTAIATISITPTGRGTITEPVSVALDLPEGLDAQWSDVTSTDAWTCTGTGSTPGCSISGALPAGTPSMITVPITIDESVAAGTVHLGATATVGSGDDAVAQSPASVSLVVLPSPVAELRAVLAIADAPLSVIGRTGDALRFSPGQSRDLTLAVIDDGSVPAKVGTKIELIATPSVAERIETIGTPGWSCRQQAGSSVSPTSPLRCTTTFTEGLAPGANVQLDLTLAATGEQTSDWTITVGDMTTHAQIDVVDDGPQMVASIVDDTPLYIGGTGDVAVVVGNHGATTALGAVAVIDVPREADVVGITAPGWTCIDATLTDADGSVTCSTGAAIAVGTYASDITLSLAPASHSTSVTIEAWVTTGGQFDGDDADPVVSTTISVAGSLVVDAGQDLTVVTPQLAADGSYAPAVVQLTGSSDLASASNLQWSQRCLQPGDPACGGTVTPAVIWNGVASGSAPATVDASFTAPAEVTSAQDLVFQLTGRVGSGIVEDQVTVHLVPAALDPSVVASSADADASAGGPATTVVPFGPDAPVQPPTAHIGGAGSVLQVPTVSRAQLVGSGTGDGALTYSWTQTSGPAATIVGSASQSTLVFDAPLLDPDQISEDLAFELTVTDSTGATATATAAVQVVWGDDGLQVTIAGGATSVAAMVDAPVAITSKVISRGAPYTYSWSVDGVDLPGGTVTDAATLAFTTGDAAANATATLTVTDSFDRVTTRSVPLVISAFPAGRPPAAFCTAIAELSGPVVVPATVSGTGVRVTIPTATVTGSTGGACASTTIATFVDGIVMLPGGVSIVGAHGELTAAGVSITSGTVSVPTNWSLLAPTMVGGGLFSAFVSDTAIGVPTGSISSASLPMLSLASMGLSGWTASTTITFSTTTATATDPATGIAVVDAIAGPATSGSGTNGSVQLAGSSSTDAILLSLTATGVVGIGPVDLPVAGTISTSSATSPVAITATAGISTPAALGGDVAIASASLTWTPGTASGPLTLALGAGDGVAPMAVASIATVTATGTQFVVAPGASWTPGIGAPALGLTGSGSLVGSGLTLSFTAAPSTTTWSIAKDVAVSSVGATISVSCAIDGSQPCAPTSTVTATASSPTFSGSASLTGAVDWSSQQITLAGSVSSVTIAPLTVSDVTLAVTASPTTASVTGMGSVSSNDINGPASVEFSSTSSIAAVAVGAWTITNGWTIPATTVYVTDVTVPYSTPLDPSDPGSASVTVTLPAGQLTGVGLTQLPSSLGAGVLPATTDAGTVALATFPIVSGTPPTYSLVTALPTPWWITGSAESSTSLALDTIGFTVSTTNGATTVGVSGSGALTADAITGTGSTTLPMTYAGTLTTTATGPTLSGTFTPTGADGWPSAFGVAGLSITTTGVATTITAAGGSTTTTANFTGTASLPASLASPLGIPATATPNVSIDLTDPAACVVIDLGSGGAGGVDIGGAGLVVSTSASLVIATQACTLAGTAAAGSPIDLDAGLWLVLDGGMLGTVQLPIDPSSFDLDDTVSVPSLPIGGVVLSDTSVDVTITAGVASITVSGTTQIDSTPVTVSGEVQMPTSAGSVGTLVLDADIASLPIGFATVTDASLTMSAASIATSSSGSSQVVLTGSMPILGTSMAVSLSGTVAGGAIDHLDDVATDPSTWSLDGGADTLAAAFSIIFDITTDPTLSVTASGATFVSQGTTFSDATVTISDATTFVLSGASVSTNALGTVDPTIVAGNYTYAGTGLGDYSFTTPSTASVWLAGYDASTDVTYSRASGSTTATQTSTIDLGLWDGGGSTVFTGAPGATSLSGAQDGVAMRGLSGSVAMTIDTTEIDMTFTTTSATCDVWSGLPTFTGVAYRSGTTSYYTLTSSVSLGLPGGFSLASIPGYGDQPVVISNETLPGEQGAPDTTISMNLSFTASAFTATGTVSFDLTTCAYSIGGQIAFVYGGSEQGEELQQSMQQPPVQLSLGNLFPSSGGLPSTIASVRAAMQADAIASALDLESQAAQQAASLAQQAVNTANEESDAANGQLNVANQNLDSATSAYAAAVVAMQNASDELETAEAFGGFERASDWISSARTALANAEIQAFGAQQRLASANTLVDEAQSRAQEADDDLQTATEQSANLTSEAEDAAEQAKQAQQARSVQVTFDYTHCSTCQTVDTFTIDGEWTFAMTYLVGIDLSLGWGPDGFQSITGTVTGGLERQYNLDAGPLGLYIDLQVDLQIAVGYSVGQSWTNVTVALQGQAEVIAYASFWGINVSDTLLDIQTQLSLELLPQDTLSGTLSIDVFDIDVNADFGPDVL